LQLKIRIFLPGSPYFLLLYHTAPTFFCLCRFDATTNFRTVSTLLLPVFESDIERFRAMIRGEEVQQQQPGRGSGRVMAVVEFSNKGGINAAEGFGDVDLVVAKSVARRYG
jgi:hypothetical protein